MRLDSPLVPAAACGTCSVRSLLLRAPVFFCGHSLPFCMCLYCVTRILHHFFVLTDSWHFCLAINKLLSTRTCHVLLCLYRPVRVRVSDCPPKKPPNDDRGKGQPAHPCTVRQRTLPKVHRSVRHPHSFSPFSRLPTTQRANGEPTTSGPPGISWVSSTRARLSSPDGRRR